MRRITIFTLCLILLISIAGCRWKMSDKPEEKEFIEDPALAASQGTTEDISQAEATEVPKPEQELEGVETFALFGVDTRAKNLNKGTRSDSVMIAVVDHENKTVRIASVFRDTLVDVEGHGLTKLTHAHSYGGPELALDTLNRNFDLQIEDYATVNFINIRDLVDEIGGIPMKITKSEAKYINRYINELNSLNGTDSPNITEAGEYILDGNQAVAYTRIRYTAGGDYKRAERQRVVIRELFKKIKETDTKDAILLMSKMIPEVNTNCTKKRITTLLYYMSDYEIEETKSFPAKLWGGKISSLGNLWYAVPVTLEDTAKGLHRYLYDEEDYKVSEEVRSISGRIKEYADHPNEVLKDDPSLDAYQNKR